MSSYPTVVVLDEDASTSRSMRRLFESEGFPVETYSDAQKFLEQFDPTRSGCVILDLKVRGVDGLALQQQLMSRIPDLPIIFVTGHGDVSKCAQAMKAGAVEFFEKPVDGEILVQAVRMALEHARSSLSPDSIRSDLVDQLACLTKREYQVMKYLCEGKSMKFIAGQLHISIQTVAKHRTRVLDKLGVNNDVELVRHVLSFGQRQ